MSLHLTISLWECNSMLNMYRDSKTKEEFYAIYITIQHKFPKPFVLLNWVFADKMIKWLCKIYISTAQRTCISPFYMSQPEQNETYAYECRSYLKYERVQCMIRVEKSTNNEITATIGWQMALYENWRYVVKWLRRRWPWNSF